MEYDDYEYLGLSYFEVSGKVIFESEDYEYIGRSYVKVSGKMIFESDLIGSSWTTSDPRATLHALQSNPLAKKLIVRVANEDPALMASKGELWGQFLEKSQALMVLGIEFDSLAPPSSISAYMFELVSGLRRNPHHAIKWLTIRHLSESSVTFYVSEIIRCMRKLETLRLSNCRWNRLSEEATTDLAYSIAGAVQLNLKQLTFRYWGDECGKELLRKIYPAEMDSGSRYLPFLNIITSSPDFWELFPFLAGTNISTIRVTLPFKNPISHLKACVETLKLSPLMSIEIDRYVIGGSSLLEVWLTLKAKRCSTGTLIIQDLGQCTRIGASSFATLYEIGASSFATLYEDTLTEFFQYLFAGNILSSSSITHLEFRFWGVSKRWGESVFESLKSSGWITSLSFTGCDLQDSDFEHLMSLLRVKFTIREVKLEGTSWRNDGKAALIEEALARNEKETRDFSILKGAGLEFESAKVGRIFMCGSPYAGKTELKLCMMRLHHKRGRGKLSDAFFTRLKLLELRRTRGAEVEVLINNKEGQVSLWDLAGQYIFRALHDLIFPRTNQSLIFVFAFNPFREDSKNMKENVYRAFTDELEEWLKFIASNCQTSGASEHLPQVLVVITHRDWMDKSASKSFECGPGSRVLKIVENFRSTFQDVVELISNIYHVDAHSKKDVQPFLKDILALMNNWSKNHLVPVVCSTVSSALIAHVESSSSASPVWSFSRFYDFCLQNHEELESSSREVLFTIASYLHDVGRIIIVPECSGSMNDKSLVIIDPNWCTENFLGAMIAEGNHFSVHGGSCSGGAVFTISSDGFIDEADFHSLLQKILGQMKHEGIGSSLLEDLLQRLDLCYRFEDDASVRYFVPVICGGLGAKFDLRYRELPWFDGQTEGSEYVGYRLHCGDTIRTSFNKAFFSRFQVNLRQKLIQRLGIKQSSGGIICGLGLLKVMYDGYVVLMESDEVNGQHVDIMIKSSQERVKNLRTRMQIISFAKEHFLQELKTYCASPNGCPGLRLIESVIRTSSVQNLVPIHERRIPEHILELEELKVQFRLSIDLILEALVVDVDEESLLNFQYTWPDGGREFAKDVLGQEDLIDILAYARGKLKNSKGKIESCSTDLQRMLTILSGEATSFDGRSPFLGRNADSTSLTVTFVEEAETSRGARHSPASEVDNLQLSEESKLLADTLGAKVEEVGEKLGRKIDNLAHLTYSVYTELQEVKNLLHNFRTKVMEMQRVMTEVNSSIDKLIGYSISREDHSCPCRPYFSQNDSGFLPKVKAFVLKGQAVRLHFLCEARNQPHVVEDQPGLPLVVTQTNMSWVPIISKISLKLISMLVSVGIHLISGVQIDTQEVLHFINLDTGKRLPMSNKLLDHLKQDDIKISVNPADPCVLQSWSLLQKYLGEELNYGEYRNTFGLCHVRYRYSSDPYAWICQSCLEKGRKQKILDECPPV